MTLRTRIGPPTSMEEDCCPRRMGRCCHKIQLLCPRRDSSLCSPHVPEVTKLSSTRRPTPPYPPPVRSSSFLPSSHDLDVRVKSAFCRCCCLFWEALLSSSPSSQKLLEKKEEGVLPAESLLPLRHRCRGRRRRRRSRGIH